MSRKRIHISRLVLSIICGLFSLAALGCFSFALIVNLQIKTRPDWVPASFCSTMDTAAPRITLNGGAYENLVLGDDTYNELGAVADDDCGVVSVEISGEVDDTKIGVYTVTYTSTDKLGNTATETRTVNVVPKIKGTVYLTFDDGPGPYTAELLDVLKKYNVKATFFVTGAGDDSLILREYQEGHAVGLHSFTHQYSYIYQNQNTYFEDLNRIQERVKNITGEESKLMRFPGGSSNTVSRRYDGKSHIMTQLVDEVGKRGFTYFDWNVSSGDAEGATTADEVVANVTSALKEGGSSVVLQHDVKKFSVEAVERIIQYGITNGYAFDKLDTTSFTAHHGVNN